MDDIILERSPPTQILKLDDDEQALMNEIEITPVNPAAEPGKRDSSGSKSTGAIGSIGHKLS